MNYPVWDAAVGYGALMALVSVVHVFLAHFAIGGGLYLVVEEHRARRRGDAERLEFLERMTRFFVLATVVGGALTGVGIWFVIGLISPAATELLIHHFVWGWAIEWTFFVVEILAALLYYYGWRRMAPRAHLTLGWIYFVAAWLSLAVINGILTFMLTPGAWLETGDFWDGILNPGYLPSLALRTGIAVLLAGLVATLVASRAATGDARRRLARDNAIWALAGLAIAAPSYLAFLRSIPPALLDEAHARMPWVVLWLERLPLVAAATAAAVVLFGWLPGRRLRPALALVPVVLGFALLGSFEFLRESIRKPWIVTGAMYGNAVEPAKLAASRAGGVLAGTVFRTGDDGRDLFLRACRSCHPIDGYQGLAPLLAGSDLATIAGLLRGLDRMRGNMPPFPGDDTEIGTLATWLGERVDRRPLAEIHGLAGAALGAKAYDVRCGRCHVAGGWRDVMPTFAGLTEADIAEFLDTAGDIAAEMPPYTGDETERAALAAHIAMLANGGAS